MKKISVFILDDDRDAVSRIEYLVKGIPGISIVGTSTNPELAVSLIRSLRPDLLFLDIEMPGLSGFDIVNMVRTKTYNPWIVFITGYDKYAIKAIRKSAFDYILKPVDPEELEKCINRIFSKANLNKMETAELEKGLTKRETQVFQLMRSGLSSSEIAENLSISRNTVDTHRRNILKKLKVKSTVDIILNYPIG
jgi:DNA-binding NarL/FixJ family response regulator